MKKLIFTLAAVIVGAFSANAQLYLGGKVSIGDNFSIKPEIGYVLNDTWAVGGIIGYDDISENFSIEPYARWTFVNQGPVSLFLDGAVGLAFGDETGFSVGVKPGMALKLSRNFSFVSHVGFLGYKDENFIAMYGGQEFGFDLDMASISLGLFYNF